MTLPSRGLKVCRSIDIARIVLATTSASAPAASHACATSAMSPVFGVSFTQSGSAVAARSVADHGRRRGGAHGEGAAVLLDIGAGDIGLDGGDAGHADVGRQRWRNPPPSARRC